MPMLATFPRMSTLFVGFAHVMKAPFSLSAILCGRSSMFTSDSTTTANKIDFWSIRRQKFMNNILGLVTSGKVEEADLVFSAMIEKHGVRPTTALYNALIKGHAKNGNAKTSFRLFNDLKKRGLVPSYHTYSSMFGACARAGPEAADIINKLTLEMERRDVKLNTVSYNAQLSALVHCDLISQAFELFSNPQAPESTIETFGTLLLAAAKDGTEGVEKGVLVWNELVRKFKPNLYCYNTLLLLIRDGGIPNNMTQSSNHTTILPRLNGSKAEVDKCIMAVKEASLKFSPSDKSLQVKVFISERGIRWIVKESLSNILQSMKFWKIKPDIRTVSILSSLVPCFSDILLLAEANGIKADNQFFNSASQLRRACGDVAGAKDLLKKKVSRRDTNEKNLQVSAGCSKVHHDVMKVLATMKDRNAYGDVSIWINLVGSCVRQRDYKTLLHLLKEMKFNEVVVSAELLQTLDNAVSNPPKNPWLMTSFNGFKGYYRIWSKSVGNTTLT